MGDRTDERPLANNNSLFHLFGKKGQKKRLLVHSTTNKNNFLIRKPNSFEHIKLRFPVFNSSVKKNGFF